MLCLLSFFLGIAAFLLAFPLSFPDAAESDKKRGEDGGDAANGDENKQQSGVTLRQSLAGSRHVDSQIVFAQARDGWRLRCRRRLGFPPSVGRHESRTVIKCGHV